MTKSRVQMFVLSLAMAAAVTGPAPAQTKPYLPEIWKNRISDLTEKTALPESARSLETFKQIKPDMTMVDILKIVGMPAAGLTVGVPVLVYELDDGSVVWIGTSPDLERVVYVIQRFADGTESAIVAPPVVK